MGATGMTFEAQDIMSIFRGMMKEQTDALRREFQNLSIQSTPNGTPQGPNHGRRNTTAGSAQNNAPAAEFEDEPGTFIPQKGPFALSIQRDIIPQGFKMPVKMAPYEPSADPNLHMKGFNAAIQLTSISEGKKCKLFPTTLGQEALHWYSRLPDYSISTFEELEAAFLKRFATSIVYKKPSTVVADLIQGPSESLRDFLKRFSERCHEVEDLEDSVAIHAFKQGLRPGNVSNELALANPKTLDALLRQVSDFILKEDNQLASKSRFSKLKDMQNSQPNGRNQSANGNGNGKWTRHDRPSSSSQGSSRTPFTGKFRTYHILTVSRSEIWRACGTLEIFPVARPLPVKHGRPRDTSKHCRYHNGYGHTTDECISLKDAIEQLIRDGHLAEYKQKKRPEENRDAPNTKNRKTAEDGSASTRQSEATARNVINTISGGIHRHKTPHNRKTIIRSIMCMHYTNKRSHEDIHAPITFTHDELKPVEYDEPMVITARIGEIDVRRILVDQGSSSDILYFHAFQHLGIPLGALKPFNEPLIGFAGTRTPAEGVLETKLTLEGDGDPPRSSAVYASFIIVAAPSAYNAILGRPSLNAFRAVISTAHLLMKFPTRWGTASICGDQLEGRRCYATSLARVTIDPGCQTGPFMEGKPDSPPPEPAGEDADANTTEITDLRDEVDHASG